ncbi:MAG: LptF/LptG family permease [Candidatus Krumholzibacteria bacterium]|nr:LptF/LptG family permease [Candidatus Krumholzibacteria bacterium]
MRIHDRYILSGFWRNVFLGLIAFAVIFVTVDINEEIDNFIDHDATIFQVTSYYLFELPWILLLVTPVAVLLSTIFTLGKLSRNNELTAFIASGTSLVRVAMPLFISAFFITGASIVFNDILVPMSKRKSEEIMLVQIEKRKKRSSFRYKTDLHYQGENSRTYYAERYDISMSMMVNIIVNEYDGATLAKRIDAKKAFWDGLKWVFVDGVIREFHDSGESITNFRRREMPELPEKPEDFSKEDIEPEEMRFSELLEHIDKVRRGGGSIDKYKVDLYFKFSFPFTSLIFALIGVALSSAKRKPSMATGFGMTLLISFTYYGILRIGQALGHSGVLEPMLSAWLGNIVFFLLGVTLLYRANK